MLHTLIRLLTASALLYVLVYCLALCAIAAFSWSVGATSL